MKCLERFKRKMELSGGSIRGENIQSSRKLLSEVFDDDAAYTLGLYRWRLGLKNYDGEEPVRIRLDGRKQSNANGITIKFQSEIDTPIVVGDVLYDSLNDEYLLCTEAFLIGDIHYEGVFSLCNWMLRWQLKGTGEIVDYPCHTMNATQYNSGEESNKQFTVGSSQHMIKLPYDENTVALKSPQRFYLDRDKKNPLTYIVTQNDTTSFYFGKKGIVRVTVYEHAGDPARDRPDLGVCDYMDIESIGKVENENDGLRAEIVYDSSVITSGGDTQKYCGYFYDENGNAIEAEYKWSFICPFESDLDVRKDGNAIYISIDNDAFVDEDFKLILQDEYEQYYADLILHVRSLL